MSELSKNQLTTENNNSFPNNNTGYITPTLLRTFNQNMIDSLVDEQQYNVDSASFNQRINVLDPSGSAQAINALQIATASLNAYTQSQNSFNSSATASIVALQNFSSSLDTTYATDAQLSASVSALSSSVTVTTNGLSSSILALQQFSSSLDNTYATDTQLSASASTLQNNINSLSQSVAVTDLAQSQSIAALQQFSSSLDSTFATDAQLSASASTLQNNINTKLDSASFNTYTQSAASGVSASINAATSSLSQSLSASIGSLSASVAVTTRTLLTTESFNVYTSSTSQQIAQLYNAVSQSATTGSNTFIGNQIISGNLNIAGNITAESASFLYLTTVYETASIIFSSGSNQLGDELSDVQTLSGSVRVQGGLTVNGVPVQTSSFDASGYLLTSSFNTYTQSAAANVTSSISALSSSIAVTTNNLDLEVNQKLDSSSFNSYTQSNDTKVNALIAQTGSYAISSSVAATFDAFSSSISLTYATETELSASASTLQNGINSKVENSTFNTYTQSQAAINAGLTAAIATRLTTASFNSYTSSNDSKVNSLIAATGSYITSAQTGSMTVLSSSFATTASFALNVTPTDVTPFLSKSVFDAYTGSAALGVSESINSATQSLSSSIAVTTNNLDLEVNGKLDSSSFNTYTQSNDSKVNSLISATGSYITSAQTSSMSVLSASFAITASYALNVTPTDVSMFVSQSTFNAYTSSNDGKVNSLISATSSYAISSSVAAIDAAQDGQINSLIAQTSSYVTESETGSFARVNVSNVFTQNQTISGNLDVTGKITALSASITYLETIYQTSSVVYSSGSNILGDELSDTQTLSGSVLVQGLLRVNGVAPILVGETASYASASISSSFATTSTTASFALNGGVTQLLAGPNITISPLSGKGQVTISSTGTGSGGFNTATGSYGSFYDTTTQTNPVANAANSMSFNETAITNGVSVSGSTNPFNTYIKTENAGVYNLQFSAQLDKTDSGTDSVDIWIRKNGIDLLDTGTTVTLTGNNDKSVAAWNWFVQSAANDYYQIIWSSADTDMRLLSEVSSSIHPGIPSVIATANRVDQFLSNTGSFSGTFNGYNLTEFTTTSSFNSYTQSNDSKVNSLIAKTGSYATTGSNTFVDTQTIDLSATAILTASAIIGNADKVITDMYVNGGNYDTFNVLVSASNGVFLRDYNGVDTTPFLSVDTNGGNVRIHRNTNLTGSLIVSGGFNAKVAFPLINNTNNILQSTGSIIVAQDIVRSGGGANDVASLRLQARTGSAGAGDALTSTISAQNNLNTTTFLSASAVASLQATFSTGSGGGTVGYNAGLTATAQSGSAISVLSGNTIRLGTNAANIITTTGSFGPMTLVGPLNQPVFAIRSGSVEITTPQGSGSFYSNLPITSSHARFNGQSYIKRLNIEDNGGAADLQVENNAAVSGNLTVSGQIMGSASYAAFALFAGSSSFATNANSANTAITASYVLNAVSASYVLQSVSASFATEALSASFATSASQAISSSFSTTASFALNVTPINTSSLATTGSNIFVGNQTITGSLTLSSSAAVELRVIGDTVLSGSTTLSGSVVISGSSPVQQWVSGGLTLSGSLLSNVTDIYTGSNNANFIVTLGSASMASLIAGGTTNPNTLYFVI